MLLKKINKLASALFLLFSMKAGADDKIALAQLLSGLTLGNDGFYNRVISPAKSLNLNLSNTTRTHEINSKMANEIGSVLMMFKMNADENKLMKLKSLLKIIDSNIISNGGANMQVLNGVPSAAFSRTFIMIEKKPGNARMSAEQLLKSLSSYKRSAIPSAYVYEYSDARNISQSVVSVRTGTDQSWKLPQAAGEITKNKDLVLKKCRQIFGWKCVTSLYKTGELAADASITKYLYAGIYDLENNPDHVSFSNDKRSFNQITGSTALYAVSESAKWILLYGIDSQWNEGSISFVSLIQEEFLKDAKRIKERIALDMQISSSEIK